MSTKSVQRPNRSWVVPLVVLAVAAALIALIVALNREPETSALDGPRPPSAPGAPTDVQGPEQPDFTVAERREDGDLLAAGPVDAQVVLVVFSDYQCPFCARWNAETLPLMQEHVEAGDLRIEWRDVNVFGPASERAATAAYAAALQGAFWEYHDALFEGGQTRAERDLSDAALISLAAELGLDTDRFTADLRSEQTTTEIARNEKLGLDLGAYSTPAFIMGGQPIIGAQPSQVFTDAFNAALGEVK